MTITPKDMIRIFTPPVLVFLFEKLLKNRSTGTCGLSGDYQSWDEAVAASIGYDDEAILEKTRIAMLKVKRGEAAYARDSVLFNEIQYAWPLLAGLMWVAVRSRGKLNVLDFGGSLGTTYFQNRVFLSKLPDVRWNIIEQARHIDVGKKWFEDNHLRFYMNIADCMNDTRPNVVILGGVLQYLSSPYVLLDELQKLPLDYIFIDRTPFWNGPSDKLFVQTVPPSIYSASYPSWVFSESQFHSSLGKKWEIMEEFESIDKLEAPIKVISKGFLLVRKHGHGK